MTAQEQGLPELPVSEAPGQLEDIEKTLCPFPVALDTETQTRGKV